MTLLKSTERGNVHMSDTKTPLIIKPGESELFCFVTNDIQKHMKLGNALREAFERGDARCHVEVRIRRAGLFKTQYISSETTNFTPTSNRKE